jgi:hypothetical protein
VVVGGSGIGLRRQPPIKHRLGISISIGA